MEDSPTQAMQTRLALQSQGFSVVHAVNGIEALDLARGERPDAIMSDILMPGMDGFALVREVREDQTLSKIPIILHTATFKSEEDRAFALEVGADAFSEKGMAPEGLASLLREVIAKESAANTLDEASFSGRHGERLLERLIQGKKDLEQADASLTAALHSLAEHTQQILETSVTAHALADQSNLLALNTVIEARRAGGHGEQLRTEANRLRHLGDQSKQAATRVRSILADIQEGTNEAVRVTTHRSDQVDVGVELAEQAAELMGELAANHEAATATQPIAPSGRGLTENGQIHYAMTDDEEETSRPTDEEPASQDAVEDLDKLVITLRALTEKYRV